MAEVILNNVTKVYEAGKKVVDNVCVEINDKEFVVLVGPSGCGKSTTLRMIAGLEEISSGQIMIDGEVVNDKPPKDRDIAMVFQNYALYPHMTVYENMAFGLKLRKYDKKEIENRVNDAAKILELENYLNKKPKSLSGGQRQRVAVGRAIVRKPKVFLFDEPLSNLDAKLRVQMRTEISKLHKSLNATMIYVTHDQTEAMTMGDRIVVMKEGVIQQIDTPLNLYNNPANKFVAGFIGSPSMNFIDGVILSASNQFKSNSSELTFHLNQTHINQLVKYENKKITIGIRPEDFFLEHDKQAVSNVINVYIELIEPMGNEMFVHFSIDGNKCVARISPTDKIKESDKVTLAFNLEKLKIFDVETNKLI
ncbi:MAG: sn-glycerol-3-phosphate ABC transporter ATP-binding protein UgpC [Ignavibacteriales bacterium]|nr:sn-glycerol-3-phosphate ABC transporter ATP-binding protein UgpC [Ignavibacteriales bacterium]